MNSTERIPQITVLDAGGQYCHLIARKVRDLGVYADVKRSDTPAAQLAGRRGLIISGGPNSVYDPGSPTVDPSILSGAQPVLGVCYGLQLMAHVLGGKVVKGQKGEFGLATLEVTAPDGLFAGLSSRQQIWMSHRDTVAVLPAGFSVLGRTGTCAVAAMAEPERGLYAVQYHPEVIHTIEGRELLSNFIFSISKCDRDWDPAHRAPAIEEEIRRTAGARNVFFFVSGGVDSTVAYTLCLRALGRGRVRGVYVDTGLMREGETDFVQRNFDALGAGTLTVEHAEDRFLHALAGIHEPERKRQIIGEEFLQVQERIVDSRHLLDGHWVLGQGTIYPDTIESGGTEHAALIKTHHNRVAGVQRLIAENRIVEPLTSLYKDEVRLVGRELGLPVELLDRHPFPGPGLAIRCLCSADAAPVTRSGEYYVIPVHSVGVQGDCRSYAPVLAIDQFPGWDSGLHELATSLINSRSDINRVIALAGSHEPLAALAVTAQSLSPERLTRLRKADAIVRRISSESGFDRIVWQFPVVLIPLGSPSAPDSIVLRPIDSVDGMTAQSVTVDDHLLHAFTREILQIEGISAVFYDLTHKPPGTIEWE